MKQTLKEFVWEWILAIILIKLLFWLLNPFDFWMPSMAHTMLVSALIVVSAVTILFVMKEKIHDEREGYHRLRANRGAFLAGAGVLFVGAVVQALTNKIDPWLALALVAMVLGKIISLTRSRINE